VPADDDDHVFTLHTHVAQSDAEAKAQCKAAYDLYVDTRLYARKHVYEDLIASRICPFGSVATVVGKMRRLHEMGIRHVATMHNFGALTPELVERSYDAVCPRGDTGHEGGRGLAAYSWACCNAENRTARKCDCETSSLRALSRFAVRTSP